MKGFYQWLIGFIVFYFIAYIFQNVIRFNSPSNGFDGVFISATIFGLLVAFLPTILGFFKIKESNGALLLGGLVVNFLFYFLGYYLLNLFAIADSGVVFFFHPATTITITDKVLGLILISLVSSAIIVALQSLNNKK